MTIGYKPRTYRAFATRKGLISFSVLIRETDLWICAESNLERQAKELVIECRSHLEGYIHAHPDFAATLAPFAISGPAPQIVRDMASAGELAGVGPMAAVAGAVAQYVGNGLAKLSGEIIVENGGDVFFLTNTPITMGVFAGDSPLGARIGIRVDCNGQSMGVCTSSAKIGHSLSFGKADAVVVIARSCALADAAATASANIIKTPKDVAKAVDFARAIPGVKGVMAICGNRLGTWGNLELVPIKTKKP